MNLTEKSRAGTAAVYDRDRAKWERSAIRQAGSWHDWCKLAVARVPPRRNVRNFMARHFPVEDAKPFRQPKQAILLG